MLLREYLQTRHSLPRRKFTTLIDDGQILLDSIPVESYKHEVTGSERLKIKSGKYKLSEIVKISNKIVEPEIILFNKPKGCVVSKGDSHNDTIYGLLPQKLHKYYYIGRLDKESHGLLLLTNDPKLVHEWEHPKFEIEKEYIVELDKKLEDADRKKAITGIVEEGDLLRVSEIEIQKPTIVRVMLREGKKRHIRRMFRALGYKVWDLQRIREGDFVLGDLPIGEWVSASDIKPKNRK